MIRTTARAVGMVAVAVLAAAPAVAGWKEVPIDVAVPARLETEPGEKTLVARFRADDHERIDVGLEVARWVRREIARRTPLSVLDVPPPPIPEQRPERMAVNDTFWRQLGKDFDADLILSGTAEYSVADRSGFVTEDVISPVTGQTERRTRFAQLTAFRLKLQVFFFKGDNGALLHDGVWSDERVMEGAEPEDLHVLYELLDTMADDLRAVLQPVTVKQSRFIWVE